MENVGTNLIIANELMIKELASKKLNYDHMFILNCLYNKEYGLLDIYDEEFTNEKALNHYQTLERKGFIVRDPNMVTYYIISVSGKEYFEHLLKMSYSDDVNDSDITIGAFNTTNTKKNRTEQFNEWWNLYPSTSKWTDQISKLVFSDTRPLRIAKDQCRKKYDSILNTGVVTHENLMDCLRYEIKSRKLDSIKKQTNQLCYMKGSLSYLNQNAYMAFMDLIKTNPDFIKECKECEDSAEINITSEELDNSNSELGN